MSDDTGGLDFAAFYNEFLPQVYRYVRYRVADTATAEDLAATTFEKALNAWGKRRKPDSVAPWIFRIARNAVASHYRQRGLWLEVSLDCVEGRLSLDSEPEERVLYIERWERICDGIRALSPRDQDIIALKFGSGLTNRAIAPVVGTSESNVAVILHRAMRKLYTWVEDDQVPVTPSG